MLLKAKDRGKKARVLKFTEYDVERNLKVAFYRDRRDAERLAKEQGVEVIPVKRTYHGETRTWYSVWGGRIMESKVVPTGRAKKKKLTGQAFIEAAKRSTQSALGQLATAVDGDDDGS